MCTTVNCREIPKVGKQVVPTDGIAFEIKVNDSEFAILMGIDDDGDFDIRTLWNSDKCLEKTMNKVMNDCYDSGEIEHLKRLYISKLAYYASESKAKNPIKKKK